LTRTSFFKKEFGGERQIHDPTPMEDCTRILGSSYNWSMVLFGSKKIHESLRNMPPEASVGVRLTDLFSKFGGFIRPYDVLYVFWGLKVNALALRF
jgi:hypothetical protein